MEILIVSSEKLSFKILHFRVYINMYLSVADSAVEMDRIYICIFNALLK